MSGDFIGRKAELMQLDRLLNDHEHQYITIHGFGGIGKTSLALQAVRNFNSGRVLALSLIGASKPSQIFLKIAKFLRIEINDLDAQSQETEVLRKLNGEEIILLYLDNVEDVKKAINSRYLHMKKNATALMKFFHQLPQNVKVLATSRVI